jgi:hypothetical protein
VPAAVSAFLADLPLEGAHKPLAAVAMLLAESFEEAPAYSRGRLAKELRELLEELKNEIDREGELHERRQRRLREGRWAACG